MSAELKTAPPALTALTKFLDASVAATPLLPTREVVQRSATASRSCEDVFREMVISGREQFLHEMGNYLAPMSQVETAEFEIVGIREIAGSGSAFDIDIRYDLVGSRKDQGASSAWGTG